MKVFVDSNIPMYVAGRDHPNRGPADRFLVRVRAREIEAHTSTEVLQEILFRYIGLGHPDQARQVYDRFVDLCSIVHPVTLADTDRARDISCAGANVSVRDAIHAAVMIHHGIREIATFDVGFDRIEGVKRAVLE